MEDILNENLFVSQAKLRKRAERGLAEANGDTEQQFVDPSSPADRGDVLPPSGVTTGGSKYACFYVCE